MYNVIDKSLKLVKVSDYEYQVKGFVTYEGYHESTTQINEFESIVKKYPKSFTEIVGHDDDHKFIVHEFEFLGLNKITIKTVFANWGFENLWYKTSIGQSSSENHYVSKMQILSSDFNLFKDIYGFNIQIRWGKNLERNFNKSINRDLKFPVFLCNYGYGNSAYAYIKIADLLKLDWSKFNFGETSVKDSYDHSIKCNQNNLSQFLLHEFNIPHIRAGEITKKQKTDWILKFVEKNTYLKKNAMAY